MNPKMFPTVLATVFFSVSCGNADSADSSKEVSAKESYRSFGAKISLTDAKSVDIANNMFQQLQLGDTIEAKITATINSVCQAKGCWMQLDLGEDKEVMVRFKDYGFFIPKDAAGKEVVVRGKAYLQDLSTEDQQHFAKDAGKSPTEIAAITIPKAAYAFEADGVLLKTD